MKHGKLEVERSTVWNSPMDVRFPSLQRVRPLHPINLTRSENLSSTHKFHNIGLLYVLTRNRVTI